MRVPAPGGELPSDGNPVPVKIVDASEGGYDPSEAPSEGNPVPVQEDEAGTPVTVVAEGTFVPGGACVRGQPLAGLPGGGAGVRPSSSACWPSRARLQGMIVIGD